MTSATTTGIIAACTVCYGAVTYPVLTFGAVAIVISVLCLWIAAEISSHGTGFENGLARLWNDFKRLTERLSQDRQNTRELSASGDSEHTRRSISAIRQEIRLRAGNPAPANDGSA